MAQLNDLLDELLTHIDETMESIDSAFTKNHRGSSNAGHVQITLAAGGQLQRVSLRPGWPERNPVPVINQELAEALTAAQELANPFTDPSSPAAKLQALSERLKTLTPSK